MHTGIAKEVRPFHVTRPSGMPGVLSSTLGLGYAPTRKALGQHFQLLPQTDVQRSSIQHLHPQ